MESYSPSTNGVRIKRELIDEFNEPAPSRKSLKTNQGGVKRISHFDDKDIVKCHYKNIKKENVEAEPDVHIKSEKEFEVSTQRNFRTLRNRKINLTEQASPKNVKIKKEEVIEENIQNHSGDIQRASHNEEIAELIESHDVKHKLVNVKEEPKVRMETEKRIEVNVKCHLFQEAANEVLRIEYEENVVNEKVIDVDALRTRNKKEVKKTLQNHRKCCRLYKSLLNHYEKNLNRSVHCQSNCNFCLLPSDTHGVAKNSIIKNYICACEKKFEYKSVLKIHFDEKYKKIFQSTLTARSRWWEKGTDALKQQSIDLKAL